jgi:ABC-2 type transport system permease protein
MINRYLKLYWLYFKNHIKVMMEYRGDFFIGMGSVILQQVTAIFFVGVVFQHIDDINGWSFYEILFIYGIAMTGRSIHHIFFDNLWTLGWQYIKNGNFDRLLIRPVNPLFQVCAERVQQDGFGQLVIGVIVLTTSVTKLGLQWTMLDVFFLFILILSSGFIFVAINLFFITFSFWMVDSLPIVWATFNLSEFTRYPLTIYHKGIAFLLTWIIPYGFTAFYPATYFIEHSGYKAFALWTPVVAIGSCAIAYAFWNRGIRAFTSTGS